MTWELYYVHQHPCSTVFVCTLHQASGSSLQWQRSCGEYAYIDRYTDEDRITETNTRRQRQLLINSRVTTIDYWTNTEGNTIVTCEIKLFQNYFAGLFQLMNIFQHVQCCWNNSNMIVLLFQQLKYVYFGFRCGYMWNKLFWNIHVITVGA